MVIIIPSNVNHRFWPINSCVDNMSPLTLTWRWKDSICWLQEFITQLWLIIFAFSPYFASLVLFFQLQTDVCYFCLFLTQKYKDNFEMWSKGIRKRKYVALSGDTRTRIKSFSICKYLQFVNNVLSPLSALTSMLCPLQRRPILRNPRAASRDGAIFSGESRIIPNSTPWVSEIEEDLLYFVFNSQLRIIYC